MAKEYFKINVSKYDSSKDFFVYRPASLGNAKNNAVMFIMQSYVEKFANKFKEVNECLVFWPEEFEIPEFVSERHAVVKCKHPRLSYCQFFKGNGITYYPEKEDVEFVGGAYISPKAKIGEGAVIMPDVYISGETTIGRNAYIGLGTKIMGEVIIGDDFVIRENCVIGSDSITTDRDENGKVATMPQFGRVVIGDDVHISSNCIVCRGAIDDTVICDGARIGSQNLISHNNHIGENAIIITSASLMGSATLGKNSTISGNSVLRNQVTVGDNCIVGMGSVVTKNVPSGTVVKGNPAK
ncbi:MAG: hypothetical protein IJF80_00960 [Clostridia bacterium]|nr:hypothetical protein [Clostridia bacterium]